MKNILVISATILSFKALSDDVSFNWLPNTHGQKSALSGKCNYIGTTSDLECTLRQINVKRKKDFDKANQEIGEVASDLKKLLKTKMPSQLVQSEFDEVCKNLAKNKNRVDKATHEKFNNMCNNPSAETIISALSATIIQDTKTCKVMEWDLGSFTFKKVDDRNWVTTTEPSGECSVVNIMTLKKQPEHNLWTYNQVRHYVRTETELCKQLSEASEPLEYSWDGIKSIKMDCEYIEFGIY